MQIKQKKIVLIILIIIWMATVFCFSNEKGEESSETSGTLINILIKTFPNNVDTEGQNLIIGKIQVPIRKLAHFFLFMTGGILIYLYLRTTKISTKKQKIYSVLLGCLYAITDETHQLFVPREKWTNKRCMYRYIRNNISECCLLLEYVY